MTTKTTLTSRDKSKAPSTLASAAPTTPRKSGVDHVSLSERQQEIVGLLAQGKSNKEIADFCKNTYDVKFPMFAKSSVKGSNANPLFKQLAKQTSDAPSWNFHKYLISRDGRQVLSFGSQIAPESKTMTNAIEQMLKSTP